jgi:hypothetical protein
MAPQNPSFAGASPRSGRRGGPPPPGLRREFLKKEKEVAQGRETKDKDKRHKNRLKDSANTEPNPTTSYAPAVMQYPKASSESSVQRTHSSFRDHEHDSSAPRRL